MAQLAILREAEPHEPDDSTCKPEPTYTAWADGRIPDSALLGGHVYVLNTGMDQV